MSRYRLAIIATHPVQYCAPVFRLLTERGHLHCHVFYGWSGGAFGAVHDPGFGCDIAWDVPLLDGYEHSFVRNESKDPGTHHWNGIRSRALLPAVRDWRPDALFVYGWNWRSHLKVIRAFHGVIPVLLRGDSTLIDERVGARLVLRRAVLQYVYRHVDIGVYVGKHNRDYFRRHGLTDKQLLWAAHSVDNTRFADSNGRFAADAHAWRRQLGIADHQVAVLFAGKLEPKKAPDLLLRAFLQRESSDEHLIIVGTGMLEGRLREMASGHPRVHFLGFRNQSAMPIVYRLGEVFALPSRGPGETWGLAVNEAMAAGRPVIVSDRVGCAPDMVGDGECGIVFESENEGALQAALDRLLRDRTLRDRMANNARSRVSGWSFDSQVEAIEHAVCYAVASSSHHARA